MSDDILRDGINIEKVLLEINYDNIRRLNNKLKDNNLSVAELKELMMILLKIKIKYPKENKRYMIMKKFSKKELKPIKINNYVQST